MASPREVCIWLPRSGASPTFALIRTTPVSGVDAAHCPDAQSLQGVALPSHPSRPSTKDTLLDAVWPETAVSDGTYRHWRGAALGDTAQASQYIATIQRRGYRFVALS